jgi:hypothetical protein
MLHMRSSGRQLHLDFAGFGVGELGGVDELELDDELELELELEVEAAGLDDPAGFLVDEAGLVDLVEAAESGCLGSADGNSGRVELGASGNVEGAAAGGGRGAAGAWVTIGGGASGLLSKVTRAAAATAATTMDPPMMKSPVLPLLFGGTESGAPGTPSGEIMGAPRGAITLGATATGA